MLKASLVYSLWNQREKDLFSKVTLRWIERRQELDKRSIGAYFKQWLEVINQIKKIRAEIEQKEKVIDILKNSTRGQRSTMEKEILRRFILTHLTCVPKNITFTEMDQLCNELDWFPLIGRSILFLQGDFGNVYYMIADGTVGLYLEPSKDREMIIAREFGNLRGQPLTCDDEELKKLGNNILNLKKGAGFGEYAILATSNKIRSCAAVSTEDNSMLLIMHAETYNAVLRQHHYRQKQLSSATALLSELPLFKQHNYSKIASIAYTMRSQTYSSGVIIANYNEIINNVFLIVSGQVKVYSSANSNPLATGATNNNNNNSTLSTTNDGSNKEKDKVAQAKAMIEKRIPKLAVAMLGRGQIIGEMECLKNFRTFQMIYESASANTEMLQMPATVFKENICSNEFRQSQLYKNIEEINEINEQKRVGRITRAYNAMKNMMGNNMTIENQSKEQLMNVLPVLVDPVPYVDKNTTYGNNNSMINTSFSPNKSSKEASILRQSFGSKAVDSNVTRKASFTVQLTQDEMLSPREFSSGKYKNNTSGKINSVSKVEEALKNTSVAHGGGSPKNRNNNNNNNSNNFIFGSPSNPKKSSGTNSPRPLSFKAM